MTDQQEETLQDEPTLKHEKGKFVSPFKEYEGYIQFPYPFTGAHYKTWLKVSREEMKDLGEIERLPHFVELRSAIALLQDWKLEKCSRIEVATCEEVLPLKIQVWLRAALLTYLNEQFDLKNLPKLSETS